jgi:hypothetical protein
MERQGMSRRRPVGAEGAVGLQRRRGPNSYHVTTPDDSLIVTTTDYGRTFVGSIWKDSVTATQFHPEKSQKVGLQILANFAAL